MTHSRIPKFYKFSLESRLEVLRERGAISPAAHDALLKRPPTCSTRNRPTA